MPRWRAKPAGISLRGAAPTTNFAIPLPVYITSSPAPAAPAPIGKIL